MLVLPEALEVGEEERLVPHDRSAEHAAVLIAAERRFGSVSRLEERRGVQLRVAEELPSVAVHLVRAAAVGHVHRRAGGAPVLGALVVGDDAELADGVGRRLHHLVRKSLVARAVRVVVDPVDQEVVERAAQAVHVERAFARRAVRALVERRLADAGREQRKRRVLAAVQRELAHLLAGDHLAALARVGLDERRCGGDFDLLRHAADRQLHVHAQPRADLHLHVVDERDRESRFLGGHEIQTAFHRHEFVRAFAGRAPRQRDAGRCVGERDFRVRHDAARRVAHGSDNRGRLELGACGARETEQQK